MQIRSPETQNPTVLSMKITLSHYKCISWNQLYASRHWSIRSAIATEAHDNVKTALMGYKTKLMKNPVDITVVAFLKRTIDPDNICAKILIDGLKGDVIVDDSAAHVQSVTTRCVKSDRDFTEIFIQ